MRFIPQTIAILGRQPALGIAELESLYGAETMMPFGKKACLLSIDSVDFTRLGGSTRVAKILTELPNDWQKIEQYLLDKTPEHAQYISGKLSFGISVFGVSVSAKTLARTALAVKKAIRNSGHSVRMVPHDKTELGAATVLYNKLTGPQGWELIVVSDGKTTYLAQTTDIQDIDAYAARDQARPMRDAKVGMLPPKLAQIIINLGVGRIDTTLTTRSQVPGVDELQGADEEKSKSYSKYDERAPQSATQQDATSKIRALSPAQRQDFASRHLVLDPFCGTGVVLQEAMIMDYDIYGSDLEPRMVQYSIDNLSWLDTKYPDVGDYRRIEIGDAAKHSWHEPEKISTVACETYLGKPLTSLPPGDQLAKIMQEVNSLHHKFLQNIGQQIKSGTRLCLAVPSWRGRHEFLHLSVLDYLHDLGYNRVKFKHVVDKDLIYHRDGQVVGRELLVLTKR